MASMPGNLIWETRASPRVRFFVWLATRGRFLTADNLSRRGWPNQQLCPLSTSEEETCRHLFSDCVFARQVWVAIKGWIQVDCPLQDQSHEDLTWAIWKERNGKIFNQKLSTTAQIYNGIRAEVIIWKEVGIFNDGEG
uniref:Reverse transcriptase zinc-binding domain-containing protein n=1 Tax=Oryza brachyantha TaxID=4533 RepID=J3L3L2_ORYBR